MGASRQLGRISGSLGHPFLALRVTRPRASLVSSWAFTRRFKTNDARHAAAPEPRLDSRPQFFNNPDGPFNWPQQVKYVGIPELDLGRDDFIRRHIGPDQESMEQMLAELNPPAESLELFVEQVVPPDIRIQRKLFDKPRTHFYSALEGVTREPHTEAEVLFLGNAAAKMNNVRKSLLGCGYYGTLTPAVIKRNVLENPAWYTSYTPYQPEISQGRLESLLNFQTMVSDLTGLPISNASLLDEGTAAGEAMALSLNALSASRARRPNRTFVISKMTHPQTRSVLRSRAEGLGISLLTLNDIGSNESLAALKNLGDDLVGVLVQYPDTLGAVHDFRQLADCVHGQGALLSVATDLLALTYLAPPGEWGADIAFGNSQRFGVPMGYGGPHAAFFAVQEKHKRKMPGRLVGVSKDRLGNRALRLSLQTREQHIRREKATSNVCTAQALLANMSAFYAIYHGPKGLRSIAERVNLAARAVDTAARYYGLPTLYTQQGVVPFDTVGIYCTEFTDVFYAAAKSKNIDVRQYSDDLIPLTFDETVTESLLLNIVEILRVVAQASGLIPSHATKQPDEVLQASLIIEKSRGLKLPDIFRRQSEYLTHPVFNSHHSETELLRYIHHLQSKDLSLVHSMIPLGSCTMKLNATTEMELISDPKFANMHPLTPNADARGYWVLARALAAQLQDITGMHAVSLQPNSGAQGEFAGLLTIRRYHRSRGEHNRDICLIPVSAHGTNPASAAMAGMRVVPIKCDTKTGNLDLVDLREKCEQHASQLGAMMITYPSTYGVFEPQIKKVCEIVHKYGGQVYMDGANMNAQIGLCSPGEIGADVCHLNLHKTFCIPHGGGGPGVGPIGVKRHLAKFLPTRHTRRQVKIGDQDPVSSAPFGSASILPISWAYNTLMGKYEPSTVKELSDTSQAGKGSNRPPRSHCSMRTTSLANSRNIIPSSIPTRMAGVPTSSSSTSGPSTAQQALKLLISPSAFRTTVSTPPP